MALKVFAAEQEEQECGWRKKIGSRINETRTEEALSTGASTVATACPFCMTMISDGITAKGKSEIVKTKDVAEIFLEAVEAS